MSNEREDIEMNIKKLRELKKNKKGFTLIEIIVVIVILAVLMAVAVPSVLKYLNEADNAKWMARGRSVMTTAQAEITKAWVSDSDINEAELAVIKSQVADSLTADGITIDKDSVKIYIQADDQISQAGTEITNKCTAIDGKTSALPSAGKFIVEATLKEGSTTKVIVAVPNGKIYVGDSIKY